MGLMGGISLVTMKLVDEQKSNEAFLKARTEIAKVTSVVKTTLNDPENCRSILSGRTLSATPATITSMQIPIKSTPGSFRQILQANTSYPGFRTGTISVSRPAGSPPKTGVVAIQFIVKSKNMKLWGATGTTRTITEKIPLEVTVNATNVITDCGSIVSEANLTAKRKFCDSLAGAAQWNATTNQCEYRDLRCPYGKVLVRLNSLGGPVCDDIKNKMDLNLMFDPMRCTNTGYYRIIEENGKLRVQCF